MSRIDDEPLLPGETETDRVARAEAKMPGGGQPENDPDPENEEGSVDPYSSDPEKVERVKGMRPA